MTFRLDPQTRYVTEEGCLVTDQRQCNAFGLEIEHVVLETATDSTTDQETTT